VKLGEQFLTFPSNVLPLPSCRQHKYKGATILHNVKNYLPHDAA